MVEEYESIMKNNVWEVVPRPVAKLVVGSRWIFKVKNAADGSIEKYKAKFVAKGFSQVEELTMRKPLLLWQGTLCLVHQDQKLSHCLGFTKSEADVNIYHILIEGKLVIIVLYVDALILSSDEKLIKSCKEDLEREFKMKDMGLMYYFLSLEVWQGDGELFVSQGKYANEILQRFQMESCKPMKTPLVTNWR
eukprot:PITA_11439